MKSCAARAGGRFALIWVLQNDARRFDKRIYSEGGGESIKKPRFVDGVCLMWSMCGHCKKINPFISVYYRQKISLRKGDYAG